MKSTVVEHEALRRELTHLRTKYIRMICVLVPDVRCESIHES